MTAIDVALKEVAQRFGHGEHCRTGSGGKT
jgi:hypothetical protein